MPDEIPDLEIVPGYINCIFLEAALIRPIERRTIIARIEKHSWVNYAPHFTVFVPLAMCNGWEDDPRIKGVKFRSAQDAIAAVTEIWRESLFAKLTLAQAAGA